MGLGQGWEKIITGVSGRGYSVQQTVDGGYIVCSTHDSHSYLIKTDGNGDSLWTKSYAFHDEKFFSVEQTTDGGYIVCGYTNDVNQNADYNLYLMKTDGSGDTLWTKVYPGINGERGYSVQQTTDGGYIVCGTVTDLTFSNWQYWDNDVYLIKIDANGLEQWSQTFGGISDDYGASVQQTIDGGFIIIGTHHFIDTLSFMNNEFIYLIKTNGNGIEQWNQTFGGMCGDYGYSVQQTTDGAYIITGNTESFGNGGTDVWLIKTDPEGNTAPYGE